MNVLQSLTYALFRPDPEAVLDAISALADHTGPAVVEALFDLLLEPPNTRTALAALGLLSTVTDDPRAHEALIRAANNPQIRVRRAALTALHARNAAKAHLLSARALREDPSISVRTTALALLFDAGPKHLHHLQAALDDPHWRVRSALIRNVLERGPEFAAEFAVFMQTHSDLRDPRVDGVLSYLALRLNPTKGSAALEETLRNHPWKEVSRPPWWDEDPPVIRRNLEAMTPQALKDGLEHLPEALLVDDVKARRCAIRALVRYGEPTHLASCVRLLDDSRTPFAVESVTRILDRLNSDRMRALVQWLTEHNVLPISRYGLAALGLEPKPAKITPNASSDNPLARARFAEHLSTQPPTPEQHQLLETFAADPDHRVREAALTLERAQMLWDAPSSETSWRVLAHAARLVQQPLARIAPPRLHLQNQVSQASEQPHPVMGHIAQLNVHPTARILGSTGLRVSPLGISGHYGLCKEGYAQALDAGVNVLFWEPPYTELAAYVRGVPSAVRDDLVIMCGTFEADPKGIRRDVERALKQLKCGTIDLFIVFWVRSWARLEGGVVDTLRELREEGLIRHFGLSTHSRALALRALEHGWDPIMSRHNAAHRGLERAVLPAVHARNVGLITFSNLCYGRLLERENPESNPTPAEFYRYSLSQPGVCCCLSAPSTLEQLQHNLTVLDAPTMSAARQADLRAYGDRFYRDNRAFMDVVRGR